MHRLSVSRPLALAALLISLGVALATLAGCTSQKRSAEAGGAEPGEKVVAAPSDRREAHKAAGRFLQAWVERDYEELFSLAHRRSGFYMAGDYEAFRGLAEATRDDEHNRNLTEGDVGLGSIIEDVPFRRAREALVSVYKRGAEKEIWSGEWPDFDAGQVAFFRHTVGDREAVLIVAKDDDGKWRSMSTLGWPDVDFFSNFGSFPPLVSVSPTGTEALIWQWRNASPTGLQRLGLLELASGVVTWLALPGLDKEDRIQWVSWAASVPALAAEVGNEDTRTLLFLDTSRGETEFRTLFTYTGPDVRGNATHVLTPELSPDATKVLFTTPADGATDVHLASTAGGEVEKIATVAGSADRPLNAWAPDGKTVYVGTTSVGRHERPRHVLYALRGLRNPEELCELPLAGPVALAVQPDGERILLVFNRLVDSKRAEQAFWLVSCDGSESTELFALSPFPIGLSCQGAVSIPRWSPDGTRFLYHAALSYRIRTLDDGHDQEIGDYGRADCLPGTRYLLVQDRAHERGLLKKVDMTGKVIEEIRISPDW